MKHRALSFVFPLLIFTSLVRAQEGTVFDDEAVWAASLTGTEIAAVDYTSLDGTAGTAVPDEIPQTFGDISLVDTGAPSGVEFTFVLPVFEGPEGPDVFDGEDAIGFVFPPNQNITFNLTDEVDVLEGFGFDYNFADPGPDDTFTITLLDAVGAVVETIDVPPTPLDEFAFVGWISSDEGPEVTSVEFSSTNEITFLAFGTFSFNAVSPDTEPPTSQELLGSIIDDLALASALASPEDQVFIDSAIELLVDASDPIFFETEDRLSEFGSIFFSNIFQATFELEQVSDLDLVLGTLDAIQELLSSIVDAEIEFALEDPSANERIIDFSNLFSDFADAFADAGLYVEAVALHFYAWLLALFA